jgi:hypothetical protein
MGINVNRESTQLSDFFDYLPNPLRGQPAPMPRQKYFAAGALADHRGTFRGQVPSDRIASLPTHRYDSRLVPFS